MTLGRGRPDFISKFSCITIHAPISRTMVPKCRFAQPSWTEVFLTQLMRKSKRCSSQTRIAPPIYYIKYLLFGKFTTRAICAIRGSSDTNLSISQVISNGQGMRSLIQSIDKTLAKASSTLIRGRGDRLIFDVFAPANDPPSNTSDADARLYKQKRRARPVL